MINKSCGCTLAKVQNAVHSLVLHQNKFHTPNALSCSPLLGLLLPLYNAAVYMLCQIGSNLGHETGKSTVVSTHTAPPRVPRAWSGSPLYDLRVQLSSKNPLHFSWLDCHFSSQRNEKRPHRKRNRRPLYRTLFHLSTSSRRHVVKEPLVSRGQGRLLVLWQ